MNARLHRSLRLAALAATTGVVTVAAGTPAYAAGNGVDVVNTETVQVYTSPSGEVQDRRVYEQLALTGHGPVTLKNPISTDHLRNLDGFSGVDVEDGEQVTSTTVDGQKRLRSVSDYDGRLPLDVSVSYRLDGHHVDPGELVGKSGHLEVEYHVENVTGTKQRVSFPDGTGGTVTRTVDVPVPMVGSLTTVAPSSFTDVRSGEANIAGDGKGGTQLSFTMTLFPPIGSTTADFGYTANISDGVVPRAEVSALPVNPLASPTFKSAGASYRGGADTGAELAAGATKIDTNLLKLRDGASTLLAGLIKLRNGADQLNTGLADTAAPGSRKLAAGAADLSGGLQKIDKGTSTLAVGQGAALAGSRKLTAGSGKLAGGIGTAADGSTKVANGNADAAAGATRLSAGLGRLRTGSSDLAQGLGSARTGSRQLAEAFNSTQGQPDLVQGGASLVAGLTAIRDGLGQLANLAADGTPSATPGGLPQAKAGTDALIAGIDQILAKVGTDGDPTSLVGGLARLQASLGTQGPLVGGAQALQVGAGQLQTGVGTAKGGVDQVKSGLDASLAAGGDLDKLVGGLGAVKHTAGCSSDAVCTATVDALVAGVNGTGGTRDKLRGASGGLGAISSGLATAVTGAGALKTGAAQLEGGLGQAAGGADALHAGAADLQTALATQVKGGLLQLQGGLADAVAGAVSLHTGTTRALLGATALDSGLTDAGAGAGQLADGLVVASDGSVRLAGGLRTADQGGADLTAGLGRLKNGSAHLAAGLRVIETGAGRILGGQVDLTSGLVRLDAGAKKLSDGTGTASAGSKTLSAGADKLATGLGDAAAGSGRIAGGLTTAADGAPQLVDGAQQLSDQGTKKLIGAGTSTAQSYGELYATMVAGSKRARTHDMAFGAPKDAVGLTAYSYIITGDDGEGGRNLARGLGGLALLGAGGGVFALRRRLV